MGVCGIDCLFRVRVEILFEWNAELLTDGLELLEVLFVLALVLHLELDACVM